ncbi:ATP/GTP-binding protein [Sutterella sp.]|uniref:AAA family ATPase n=1 Tax=Sutterella sp. TaxID=1981025 RepID=UPI0026DF58E3|nr:AAA family ATPase [Sutterella sp.]MDO5532350.1 AAA family ATPase [Sutterella sp.]
MTVFLERLHVRDFGPFRDVCFDLRQKRGYPFGEDLVAENGAGEGFIRAGLLCGRNGAGKSFLGRALIDIAGQVFMPSPDEAGGNPVVSADADLDDEFNKRCARLAFVFSIEGCRAAYTYARTDDGICLAERFTVDDETVFEVNHPARRLRLSRDPRWNLETLQTERFLDGEIPLLRFVTANTLLAPENPLRQVRDFVRGMLLVRATDEGLHVQGPGAKACRDPEAFVVRNGLLQDLEGFLQDLGIDETLVARESCGRTEICFRHRNADLSVRRAASGGTLRLIELFALMKRLEHSGRSESSGPASLIFLDDLTDGLHPQISRSIWRQLLETAAGQILLTVHGTALLSNRFVRPDAVWIVTRDRVAVMPELTTREIREGNDLAKLLLGGAFGEVV